MNEIELLNKKLTIEELDKFLSELMNYSARKLESPSPLSDIEIIDEKDTSVPYFNKIGYKDITIVRNILFLKERVDEERGVSIGMYKVRQSIKGALGIDIKTQILIRVI